MKSQDVNFQNSQKLLASRAGSSKQTKAGTACEKYSGMSDLHLESSELCLLLFSTFCNYTIHPDASPLVNIRNDNSEQPIDLPLWRIGINEQQPSHFVRGVWYSDQKWRKVTGVTHYLPNMLGINLMIHSTCIIGGVGKSPLKN